MAAVEFARALHVFLPAPDCACHHYTVSLADQRVTPRPQFSKFILDQALCHGELLVLVGRTDTSFLLLRLLDAHGRETQIRSPVIDGEWRVHALAAAVLGNQLYLVFQSNPQEMLKFTSIPLQSHERAPPAFQPLRFVNVPLPKTEPAFFTAGAPAAFALTSLAEVAQTHELLLSYSTGLETRFALFGGGTGNDWKAAGSLPASQSPWVQDNPRPVAVRLDWMSSLEGSKRLFLVFPHPLTTATVALELAELNGKVAALSSSPILFHLSDGGSATHAVFPSASRSHFWTISRSSTRQLHVQATPLSSVTQICLPTKSMPLPRSSIAEETGRFFLLLENLLDRNIAPDQVKNCNPESIAWLMPYLKNVFSVPALLSVVTDSASRQLLWWHQVRAGQQYFRSFLHSDPDVDRPERRQCNSASLLRLFAQLYDERATGGSWGGWGAKTERLISSLPPGCEFTLDNLQCADPFRGPHYLVQAIKVQKESYAYAGTAPGSQQLRLEVFSEEVRGRRSLGSGSRPYSYTMHFRHWEHIESQANLQSIFSIFNFIWSASNRSSELVPAIFTRQIIPISSKSGFYEHCEFFRREQVRERMTEIWAQPTFQASLIATAVARILFKGLPFGDQITAVVCQQQQGELTYYFCEFAQVEIPSEEVCFPFSEFRQAQVDLPRFRDACTKAWLALRRECGQIGELMEALLDCNLASVKEAFHFTQSAAAESSFRRSIVEKLGL